MHELVFLKGEEPSFTNSLIIAEGTNNQHESIIRLIQKHEQHFNRWGKIYFSDLKSGNKNGDLRGRPTSVALLNEQQATFLITLLRNSDVVVAFKCELVDQFYKMREILLNRRNDEWREIRKSTKRKNRKLTDAIQVLIPFAREQGSTAPEFTFYSNIERLVNKMAKIPAKSRDNLSVGQLYEVEKMLDMAATSIKGLVAKGTEYKKIYKSTKQTLENYAQISLINQRFIS